MNLLLAWRNIWRNPRRTTVIFLAVSIGIWSMVFLGAIMRGIAVDMIQNGIATLTGHIQIHHKEYLSNPVIENSITDLGLLKKTLQNRLPNGSRWTPRIRVNAVAKNARHTGGVTLVGIDPQREKGISFIGRAVWKGRGLERDDAHEIIVGQALLEEFETRLGHKLILSAQDANHERVARAFHIIGVYRAQLQATEKQYVFVLLSSARKMLKHRSAVSEVSVILPQYRMAAEIKENLNIALSGGPYEVQTWKELLPILMAYLQIFNGFIYVWYLVIFVAMGFGVVNTMLMAVFERMREFGLSKALGVKPLRLIRQVLTESFLLLLMGSAAGNILGIAGVFILSRKGIDFTSLAQGAEYIGVSRIVYPVLSAQDVIIANLVVFCLGLLISLYPAVKAARFTPVKALGHT